jgi:predicted metal-dependent phosphoesterase TrpH
MIFELHIHSKFSFDSLMSPESILKAAKMRGLNGVAVTDHNTIKGGLEAQRINNDGEFMVIVGTEINTDTGDVIGLFLNEEIESRTFLEVIDEIRSQDGVVVLPHPFRGHKLSDELISAVDAIESFNSRTGIWANQRAEELVRKYKKTSVAGSDAHFLSEIGLGSTLVDCSNFDDIKSAILAGKASVFTSQQSRTYLQNCSQLVKSLKTRRYVSATEQLVRALAGLIFKP